MSNGSQYLGMLDAAVDRYNGGEAMKTLLEFKMRAESGGNARAQASSSSACGLFQFTRDTWAQWGNGRDIFDPAAQCDAVVRFTQHNQEVLRGALGREPTAGELYLAHFAGATGAKNVLLAGDNTPISSVLSAGAIRANRRISFNGKSFAEFTCRDLEEWAASKMDGRLAARDRYNDWSTFQSDISGDTPEDELARRKGFLRSIGMPEQMVDIMAQQNDLGTGIFFVIISALLDGVTKGAPAQAADAQIADRGEPVSPTRVPTATAAAPAPAGVRTA